MIEEIIKVLSTERGEGLLIFGSQRDEGFWMVEYAPSLMAVATFQRLQREWRGKCKSRVMTITLSVDPHHDLRRVRGMLYDTVWATSFAQSRMGIGDWAVVQSRIRPRG